jgi:hypothetical protein
MEFTLNATIVSSLPAPDQVRRELASSIRRTALLRRLLKLSEIASALDPPSFPAGLKSLPDPDATRARR